MWIKKKMQAIQEAADMSSKIQDLLSQDRLIELSEEFTKLDFLYSQVKYTYEQIKLVKLNTQSTITDRLKRIHRDIEILESESPTLNEIQELQLKDKDMKMLAPGVAIVAQNVSDETFIPNVPVYYIKSTNEFGVRINGVLIKGNIGNISQTKNDSRCIACPNPKCNIENCKWLHPARQQWFSPGSWLYTREPVNGKNKYMRHIGNRDTLLTEINSSTRIERELRSRQCAHDLLVQLAIGKIESDKVKN